MRSFLYKKKGFYNAKVLTYILAVLVITLLLLLFIKWLKDLGTKERDSKDIIIDEKMKSITETLLYGSVKRATFTVPPGTRVCFIDSRPEKRKDILDKNREIVKNYPIIRDIITGDVNRNVIYINRKANQVTKSRWLPNLCFTREPYYTCINSVGSTLEVAFEGRGKCTSIGSPWSRIAEENDKNMSKYLNNQLFLSWDYDNSHTNWPNILSLVPITLWDSSTLIYRYPYTVFYNSTAMGADELIKIMNSSSANVSYILGPSPVLARGNTAIDTAGQKAYYLCNITPEVYFTFWANYSYVVISPLQNKSVALKSALLASVINAPVLYVNATNIVAYQEYLTTKHVLLFDNSSMEANTLSTIRTNAAEVSYINPDDISLNDLIESLNVPYLSSIVGIVNG
jgi:hypothetical protein